MSTHAQYADVYRQIRACQQDITWRGKTGDPLPMKDKETASEDKATLAKSEK